MAVASSLEAEARREAIVQELQRRGSLHLIDVAAQWKVHPMTIRRDFDAFVLAGIGRRVRGGVVTVGQDDFSQRQHQNASAKQTISTKLLAFVEPNMAIALDSSTTVYAFAQALTTTGISAISNGLSTFQTLYKRPGIRAYLTGGEHEETNLSLVGSLAVQSIQQFTLDACFLSTMNIDPVFGTSELTLEQVGVKQAMVEAAQKVILAVDSSKFATRARFRSLPLSSIDVLVTELNPADPRLDMYRERIPAIH